MFGKPIRLGRILGITITISWSFLVLVAALSLYLAFTSHDFLLGLVSGVLSLLLIFASILVHELGHSVVAQRLGVRIAEIELHIFGGAAKMLSMPRRPRDEILIAGAGPLTSIVLAGLFGGLSLLVPGSGLLGGLALINLILGLFNLIPALPSDGGRILRAALTPRYGALDATRKAVKVSRVATIGLGIWSLVPPVNIFGVGVAVFLWVLGTRELRMAEAFHRAGRIDFGPDPFEDDSGVPLVEVFDREGRYIGRAPGGGESREVGRAGSREPSESPAPEARGWDTPELFAGPFGPGRRVPPFPSSVFTRRVVLRGPDGRLWILGG